MIETNERITLKAPGLRLVETLDLEPYRRPMSPIPDRVAAAIERGVQTSPTYTLADLQRLVGPRKPGDEVSDGLDDCVIRNPDGRVVVACRTDMPGVSSAMWDWWFAWHGYTNERYRLWHPKDHVESSLEHDRRGAATARDGWVGNVSFVDEFIGGKLQRLAIRFVPPETVGLDQERVDQIGVAVCARTALRRERLAAGWLVHLIEDTDDGCRMHSRFLLGEAESEIPVIGRLLTRLVNRPSIRRRLLSDEAGTALLRHCSEEMNHLATLLAELYQEFGGSHDAA